MMLSSLQCGGVAISPYGYGKFFAHSSSTGKVTCRVDPTSLHYVCSPRQQIKCR